MHVLREWSRTRETGVSLSLRFVDVLLNRDAIIVAVEYARQGAVSLSRPTATARILVFIINGSFAVLYIIRPQEDTHVML